jgi:hypothetical protein
VPHHLVRRRKRLSSSGYLVGKPSLRDRGRLIIRRSRRLFPGGPFGESARECVLSKCRLSDLLRQGTGPILLRRTSWVSHGENMPASSAAHPRRCTLDAMRIELEARATVRASDNHLQGLAAHRGPPARIMHEPPAATAYMAVLRGVPGSRTLRHTDNCALVHVYPNTMARVIPMECLSVSPLGITNRKWPSKDTSPILWARALRSSPAVPRDGCPVARPSPRPRCGVLCIMRAKELARKLQGGIGNIPCSPARNRPRNPCRGAGPRNPARP